MNTPTNRDADVLLALADRCEREQPSNDLEMEIDRAITGLKRIGTFEEYEPPCYTTSLDAAARLAPSAWRVYEIHQLGPTEHFHVGMITGMPATRDARGNAKTEAMARCAAALRARAAL